MSIHAHAVRSCQSAFNIRIEEITFGDGLSRFLSQ